MDTLLVKKVNVLLMTSSKQEKHLLCKIQHFSAVYMKHFCQVSIRLNKGWRNDSYFKIGSF